MKPASLAFEMVTDADALARLEPEWRALVRDAERPELMLDTPWLFTWLKRYDARRRLAIGLFRRADALVGIAPLVARRARHRPGIPFRRLELLGSGYDDPDSVFSEYIGLIARPRDAGAVAEAFVDHLGRGAFGRFDECLLEMLDGSTPGAAALNAALAASTLAYRRIEAMPAYYLELPESWDAYLASVHGKRRNWFRRTMRDFETWVGDRGYRVERATDEASLARGMALLAALHETRWTDAGRAGAFASERFNRFHQDYARALMAEGRLDLKWLTVGDAPVAIHYNFLGDRKVYFYQSGRVMDLPSNIRIGIVMHVLSIKEAIERKYTEFDFMGGEADYKKRFTSTTRPLVTYRIAPLSLVEIARRGVEGAAALRRKARSKLRELRSPGG